ncbi:MAG: aspartate/glutamate racemase family protein [Xanthobacteraceae bacterium]
MQRIRLINPNTSETTTAMMVAIAGTAFGPGFEVHGVTARYGVPMILEETQLAAAAPGVVEIGTAELDGVRAVIVSAYGDPGLAELRSALDIPVAGICEASMCEAGAGGRRFGIATVTPGLVDVLTRKAQALGLGAQFTGIRLTEEDPLALAADPKRLEDALARAVAQCFDEDGAEAVVIGGGPLGQAAIGLERRFAAPVIAPIPSAVRQVLRALGHPGGGPTPLR